MRLHAVASLQQIVEQHLVRVDHEDGRRRRQWSAALICCPLARERAGERAARSKSERQNDGVDGVGDREAGNEGAVLLAESAQARNRDAVVVERRERVQHLPKR